MDILTKPAKITGNIYTPMSTSNNIKDDVVMTPANMNNAIIEKALGNTVKPKIVVHIDWLDFPSKQIEMLYDIMHISEEEIVEWYLNNIQMHELVDAVKESIKNNIIGRPAMIPSCDVADDKVIAKTVKENNKIGGPKAKASVGKKKEANKEG
jgi:hypothetical protein